MEINWKELKEGDVVEIHATWGGGVAKFSNQAVKKYGDELYVITHHGKQPLNDINCSALTFYKHD